MTTMIVNNYNEFVAPGTTMEFENPNRNNAVEKVIVLTDNKVMYTMLAGEPHREIMALADWLIQAMGCSVKITNSQLPLGPPPPLMRVATDAGMDVPSQSSEPVYAVGTKFSWKHHANGEETRRTAVMTKNGVLQVYEMTNGVRLTTDVTRHGYTFPQNATKMFDTLQQWKATLPGGSIVVYPYTTAKDRLKAQPITATNDYELVQAIKQRWRVFSHGYVMGSLVEQMAQLEGAMDRVVRDRMALDRADPQYSLHRRRLTTHIRETRNKIARLHATITQSTPEESNKRYPRICWLSGSTLFGNIGGNYVPVTCSLSGNTIMTASTYGPTLQSIGVQMNRFGKPDLMVRWRGKEVVLNDNAD